MVEESASKFRLKVYNFYFKGYICFYVYKKWLNLLNNDSVSLDKLYIYIYIKRCKQNNLTI